MQAGQFFLKYEDEENDKVVLASDSDLAAAVDHAKTAGLKVWLNGIGGRGAWRKIIFRLMSLFRFFSLKKNVWE